MCWVRALCAGQMVLTNKKIEDGWDCEIINEDVNMNMYK